MACQDCFNNCDQIQSDLCVKYTGPDISFLGICTGDTLSSVEDAIFSSLQGAVDGTGITSSGFTPCTFISTYLGTATTLDKIQQAFNDAICYLKSSVDTINNSLTPTLSVDASCLALSSNPTRDQILQAVASKVCTVSASVDTINSNYVTQSNLCSLVTACLAASASTQEYTKMPKYCPIPYYGPLTVFDGSGKGLSAFGYDKVYLCIGQTVNGFVLPDMRGRVPVGANSGMPGGTLDSAVDPTLIKNAGYGIFKGTKVGEYTHTLTTAEDAPHTHTVTDPGHTHTVGFGSDCFSGNNFCNVAKLDTSSSTKTSSVATTGITINSSGGGQPHNVSQPSIGVYYIMYVP